jgi:SP family myo-inositol transporter-like MFS transporter 13
MTGADEQYPSGPHAPLLASSHSSSDHGDNDHDGGLASELEYSGGWFIWALTFSAGISGLLFGYEYASYHQTRHVVTLIPPLTNNRGNF